MFVTGIGRVIVIGAGAAGSTAAWALARLGVSVTLVESKRFPRAKVCGEFISPAATGVLETILSPMDLISLGARRVRELVLERDGSSRVFEMPTPAWALSRRTLDVALSSRAVQQGARFLEQSAVARVAWREDGAEVVLANGERLVADLVIHADGSGRFDPAGATPKVAGVVGHKCHLRVPGGIGGIRMRGASRGSAGSYVGLIEVEEGLGTCALVARSDHIKRHGGDADSMLRALWPAYDPAWREGAWMSCGVARSGYIRPGHPRSIRIGNAAAAVDPVGGEGIGLAIWSGIEAVRSLSACATVAGAERMFAQAYRRRLSTRQWSCRLAAEVLMRPGVLSAVWPTLGVPALTIAPWYRLTGKPMAAG